MRLALWCTSYFVGFGGVEKIVNDLTNQLATRGKETFLIAGKSRHSAPDRTQYVPLHPAVRIYQNTFVNPFDYLRRPHVFVSRLFQYLTAAVQVGLYLRKNRIDLVHLHYVSFDVVLLVLYRWLLRFKLVITFAGSDVHLAAPDNLAGLKVRLAVKHADCVTAVSQDLCHLLAARFGCANPVYVPNGVDPQRLQQLAAEGDLPIEDDHLIFCGSLTAVKRVPFLIEAFYHCLQRGCAHKLYIVGDGEEAARIDELIARYGIADRIITLGAVPHSQVLNAISRSRCLLLSSSNEGLPMVALESLALGRPVVASYTGGLSEILVHGENGYLYPPDRQDLLSDAIMKVSSNKDHARNLGSKGPASIRKKFCLDSVVGRYCQVYEELIHAAA